MPIPDPIKSARRKSQLDPATEKGRDLRRRISEALKGRKYKKREPYINKSDMAMRKCLMCGNQFMSDGKGNRICTKCKDTSEWQTCSMEWMLPQDRTIRQIEHAE